MSSKPNKPRSSSHDRRATTYLEPKNVKILEKYVQAKNLSRSEAINDAVRLLEPFLNGNVNSKNTYK